MCASNTGCHQEAHLTPDSVLSNINTALAAALWAHAQLHSQPGPKVEKSL